VAAGGAGLWLHDRKGPSASIVSETGPCRISHCVHRAELSIVTGADRVRTVNRALAALGALNDSSNPATAWC